MRGDEGWRDGRTIGYTYDGNGNLTSITPPGRPAHQFTYNLLNLGGSYLPPQPQPPVPDPGTQYAYNLDQQLTSITRPDGQTLGFGYDVLSGKLGTLTTPSGQIHYDYALSTGNLQQVTTPDGEVMTYAYDGALPTSETWSGPVAGTVSRTYDTNFRITSQSVNGANAISFGYDADDLLTSAGALTLNRDATNRRLTGSTLGTVGDAFSYNSFGDLTNYGASAGAPLLSAQYTRDSLGRITEKRETLGGVTATFDYTYDAAGRLIDVTTNGTATARYVYDPNSNRIGGSFNQVCGAITNVQYDDQDRLLALDCGASTYSYAYTANGELLTKTDASGTASYGYDVLGNLRRVDLPDGRVIEYLVDGNNRRIGKKINGLLTQGFLYDGQLRIVAELDGSGAVISRFVYGDKVNVPEYMMRAGVTYRFITDHLGSPRLVVNATDGTTAQRTDYDEFGRVLSDTNPGFQPFGFAGGLRDQHTGAVRFGARDYEPETGRWIAKDPIRFNGGDTNLYGYVLSDPVNRLDPDGFWVDAPSQMEALGIATILTGFAVSASIGQGPPKNVNAPTIQDLIEQAKERLKQLKELVGATPPPPPPKPGNSWQLCTASCVGAFGPSGTTPNYIKLVASSAASAHRAP